MRSISLVAVLVAVACAVPVPQSTPEAAIGASSTTVNPALGGDISSTQSTLRPTPSRHTLRPFSFSPLTLKPRTSHSPRTLKPFSRSTHQPLGSRLSTSTVSTISPSSSISTSSESPVPVRSVRGVSDFHEGWALDQVSSTVNANEPITTPLNRIGGGISSTTFKPEMDVTTTPFNRIAGGLSSSTFKPEMDVSTTPFKPAGADMSSSTSFKPAMGLSSTPFQANNLEGSTTAFQPRALDLTSATTTAANRIGEELSSSSISTPSTTLNTLLSRAARAIPTDEGWALEDVSSTVSVPTELTTAANRIGEELSSSSISTASLPTEFTTPAAEGEFKITETTPFEPTTTSAPFNVRHARQLPTEGWQMTDASSTMEVTEVPEETTTFEDIESTTFGDIESTTFNGEESTTSFDDSTTSDDFSSTTAFDFENSNDEMHAGWQLAESTSAIDLSSTSAASSIPTSSVAFGNSHDESWSLDGGEQSWSLDGGEQTWSLDNEHETTDLPQDMTTLADEESTMAQHNAGW